MGVLEFSKWGTKLPTPTPAPPDPRMKLIFGEFSFIFYLFLGGGLGGGQYEINHPVISYCQPIELHARIQNFFRGGGGRSDGYLSLPGGFEAYSW